MISAPKHHRLDYGRELRFCERGTIHASNVLDTGHTHPCMRHLLSIKLSVKLTICGKACLVDFFQIRPHNFCHHRPTCSWFVALHMWKGMQSRPCLPAVKHTCQLGMSTHLHRLEPSKQHVNLFCDAHDVLDLEVLGMNWASKPRSIKLAKLVTRKIPGSHSFCR